MRAIISITLILLFFTACSNLNVNGVTLQTPPEKKMLISKANSGDIEAMVELNKYYQYPETKEGLEYYNRWYNIALKSKNPKEIVSFAKIYMKYSDMFINGDQRGVKLFQKAAKLGNKEAMLTLIEYYSETYQIKELNLVQKEYLKGASEEEVLKLFDYYIKSGRKDITSDLLRVLDKVKDKNSEVSKIIRFKEATINHNKEQAYSLMPDILKSSNSKAILNLAKFLNRRYDYKEAIKFYERAEELDSKNVDIYVPLLKLYRKTLDIDSKADAMKFINTAKKGAFLDSYDSTMALLYTYRRFPEYATNYDMIINKLLELNESKRALADFYYRHNKKGKGNELLEELAKAGNTQAILTLATREQFNYSKDLEESKISKEWKEYILNSKNEKLINQYYEKINYLKPTEKTKASDTNNIMTLRDLYQELRYSNRTLALSYLEKASSYGDVYSKFSLAKNYSYRDKKDGEKKAIKIYKDLADKGSIKASRRLGYIYVDNAKKEKNKNLLQKGINYLDKASNLGDRPATQKLIDIYLCDECQEAGMNMIDYEKANFYLERLAKVGDANALFNLGWIYNYGKGGVKQDLEKATKYYLEAAKNDFPLGYYNAAWIYYKGGKKDYKRALKYLEEGEKARQFDCINLLGIFYKHGYGVKKDLKKAITYFKKAAKYNKHASYNLGKSYRKIKDYKNAIKYLKMSERRGSSKASCELGYMYEMGEGFKKDIHKALDYYQKSYKSSKNRTAAYNIALIYQYGKGGIKKDLKLAKKWYKLSNTKDAKEHLKNLK